MVFRHAHVVPIILIIWFPFTFILTYFLAVYNEHVTPVFPYISDTGTWSPESCVFDILLTTGAIFMFISAYIRYRQVRELCEKNEFKPITKKLNSCALYLGVIAAYGVVIVGSFQETNVLIVHLIGASMCFGFGIIYQIFQTVISFYMYPKFGKMSVNIFRAICTAICMVTYGLTSGFGVVAVLHFKGDDITKWTKDDGGYDFRLVSVFSEWIMAILAQAFLASFAGEFKLVEFSEPAMSPRVV